MYLLLPTDCDFKTGAIHFQLTVSTERGSVEAVTGEFTSDKATTEGKLYGDKLKSVLASKCHLNAIIEKLEFLPASKVSSIRLPILQAVLLGDH